jgi:tetratricopeptide (TPR) repeat protein
MKPLRVLLAAAAALAVSACAGQKDAVKPGNVKLQGPKVGEGPAPERQISTRAKLLFEDAIKAFEAQQKANTWDYVALERKFEAALAEDGQLAEAEYNLGVLAERQGKKADAIKRYEGALRRKPTLRQAAENLAVIMQNDGNVQGAVQIYQQILTHYPDDASARARLAEIYRRNNDHDRAMQLAREALIREPKTLTAYKVMMRSYLDRDQLSMSRLVALRALKLDENDPELHHTIGLILLKENEKEKAQLQFKKAVEVRADFVPAHVILARMAMEFEDYPGAEEHLRRVLQADGKNPEALLNLGVAYKGMGQFDKALGAYDEAEKLNPNLAAIFLNRGIILHQHKDAPERAVELYKKYMQLAGGDVSLRADAPVFALLRDAEGVIVAKAEAKRAEEEAIRMEAEMKRQEEEAARLEAQQKAEEERQKREAARGGAAQDAMGGGDGKSVAAADKKDDGKKAPVPAVQKEEKKPVPAPAPQRPAKSDDEPVDDL